MDRLLALAIQLPQDPPPWPLALPDPKDAVFLALAGTAGAVLLSGHKKNFPTTARKGIVVLAPHEFLARLAS